MSLIRFFVACCLLCGIYSTPRPIWGQTPIDWEDRIGPISFAQSEQSLLQVLPDSQLQGFQFFFVGEEHRKPLNTRLQLTFLQYLHQHAGVRNLIIEAGFASGFLLNQYLESGNEGILRKAITNIPVCPDDQMAMYRSLYAYNQTLPEADRIRVTGIDLDYSPELSLQVLHTLLMQAEDIPDALGSLLIRIPALHQSPYLYPSDVKRLFKQLDKSLTRESDLHAKVWGAYLGQVQLLVRNTLAGYRFNLIKAMVFKRLWQKRESKLYANFLTLYPSMAPGACFAQFGVLHTDLTLSPQWEFPSLAQRLDRLDDSPMQEQVLTFSRYLGQMDNRYAVPEEERALQSMVRYARQAFPGQVVLARMWGSDSPFPELGRRFPYMLLMDSGEEKTPCQ